MDVSALSHIFTCVEENPMMLLGQGRGTLSFARAPVYPVAHGTFHLLNPFAHLWLCSL